MTHVELQPDLLPLLGRVDNVLDGIAGFVEHYDFSRANSSYEARVQAVSMVASICYKSPKALGSISLFDRLQAESGGVKKEPPKGRLTQENTRFCLCLSG